MINLSKSSWHYRLASVYNIFDTVNDKDLCSYAKSVMAGLLVVLFIILAGSVLFGSFVLFGLYVYVGVTIGFVLPVPLIPLFGSTVLVFLTGMWTLIAIRRLIVRPIGRLLSQLMTNWIKTGRKSIHNLHRGATQTNNSFVREVVRSVKEKTCVKINWGE